MSGGGLNIANAALLTVIGYFYFVYHLDPIVAFLGIALATGTWAYQTGAKEGKKLILAQAAYYEAKAEYYRRKQS